MKQRNLLALLLCVFFAATVPAQTPKTEAPERNLYAIALGAMLDEMEKRWGYINDESADHARRDYRNVLVEKNDVLTHNLPSSIGERRIRYLSSEELGVIQKKARKQIPVIRIFPANLRSEKLTIGFNVYHFSQKKKNHFYFALSDGATVIFKFDCEKNRFEVESVELWGI